MPKSPEPLRIFEIYSFKAARVFHHADSFHQFSRELHAGGNV